MVDREKAIKGLECCRVTIDTICEECPYRTYYEPLDAGDTCVADLYSDALELLKEQAEHIDRLERDLAITTNNLNYYINGND